MREYAAPLSATFALATRDETWLSNGGSSPDTRIPVGIFEAYICRGCGFAELYARDAAQIPIGREYGTELFDAGEQQGPYR